MVPEGFSFAVSERNSFEPEIITVALGVNNTVTRVNKDLVVVGIRAANTSDPDFCNAIEDDNSMLNPYKMFEFTFTIPDSFSYYGIRGLAARNCKSSID